MSQVSEQMFSKFVLQLAVARDAKRLTAACALQVMLGALAPIWEDGEVSVAQDVKFHIYIGVLSFAHWCYQASLHVVIIKRLFR